MKDIRIALFAAAALAVLLIAGTFTDACAQFSDVEGILEHNDEGGGGPDWRIRLDQPIELAGREYYSVEIYSEVFDLSQFSGSHVAASGTFIQWRTPERGKFIVLNICDIIQN